MDTNLNKDSVDNLDKMLHDDFLKLDIMEEEEHPHHDTVYHGIARVEHFQGYDSFMDTFMDYYLEDESSKDTSSNY